MTEGKKQKRMKAIVLKNECVACGCCMVKCPRKAIEIVRGVYARILADKCVGCGKCASACPASVITLVEAEL